VKQAGFKWSWVSPALLLASATFIVRADPLPATAPVPKPPHEVTASLLGPRPGTLPVGTVVPFRYLSDLSFVSVSRGYALAIDSSVVYAAVTTDGGRIWRIDGPPLHIIGIAQAPAAVDLIGTGAPSVAFAYQGGQLIDSTSDSGQHWWSALFDNELAAAAVGNNIWTLVNGFSSTSTLQTAAVWLYTSTDGGRHWFYKATLPRLSGGFAELVRPTRTTAFALVQSAFGENPKAAGIVETTDGGLTWIRRSDPCTSTTFADYRVDWTEQLQASSNTSLWLFCGSQPATGSQVKLVERSSDGGETWKIVASIAPGEHHPPNDISYLGSLPRTGTTGDLSVTSSSDAWLILISNNVLWKTTDGGRTWFEGAPSSVEDQFPQDFSIVGKWIYVKTQNAQWSSVAGKRWTLISGSNKQY
jgi:hypothetical protein